MISAVQSGDRFVVIDCETEVATPHLHPIRTVFPDLANQIALDLERFGATSVRVVCMYSCVCHCLDEVLETGRDRLVHDLVLGLLHDPVLVPASDPEYEFMRAPAFAQSYFLEKRVRQQGLDQLREWALSELAAWSPQELVVVAEINRRFHSPLLGMAVADGGCDVKRAALGVCGKYWDHAMGMAGGVRIEHLPDYWPDGIEADGCWSVCMRGGDAGGFSRAGKDGATECCVVRDLDVLRRFAQYGRLQRVPGTTGQSVAL